MEVLGKVRLINCPGVREDTDQTDLAHGLIVS